MSEPYLKIPWIGSYHGSGDDWFIEGTLTQMEQLWKELNKVFRRQIIPSELLPYDPEAWKRKGTGIPPVTMYGAQIPDNITKVPPWGSLGNFDEEEQTNGDE